jgi:hypothetical protein
VIAGAIDTEKSFFAGGREGATTCPVVHPVAKVLPIFFSFIPIDSPFF